MPNASWSLAAAALLLSLVACGGDSKAAGTSPTTDRSTMNPGQDCMKSGCHTNFTAAGTVYAAGDAAAEAGVAGATVTITDKNGARIVLTSNGAGNFYTSQAIAFPGTVTIASAAGRTRPMNTALARGGCNSCHFAPGRIIVP